MTLRNQILPGFTVTSSWGDPLIGIYGSVAIYDGLRVRYDTYDAGATFKLSIFVPEFNSYSPVIVHSMDCEQSPVSKEFSDSMVFEYLEKVRGLGIRWLRSQRPEIQKYVRYLLISKDGSKTVFCENPLSRGSTVEFVDDEKSVTANNFHIEHDWDEAISLSLINHVSES